MPTTTRSDAPAATAAAVRERLVEALRLDLVGPGADHALAAECLPGWTRPSNWYLTGFLVPSGMPPEQNGDVDEDDDLGEVPETANLTEAALDRNVELGLVVRDPALTASTASYVRVLIDVGLPKPLPAA